MIAVSSSNFAVLFILSMQEYSQQTDLISQKIWITKMWLSYKCLQNFIAKYSKLHFTSFKTPYIFS